MSESVTQDLLEGYTAYAAPTEIEQDSLADTRITDVGTSVSLSVSVSYSVSWSWSWT